jgi:hypothetical protein
LPADDAEGEATISFIPIKPGKIIIRIPRTNSDLGRGYWDDLFA